MDLGSTAPSTWRLQAKNPFRRIAVAKAYSTSNQRTATASVPDQEKNWLTCYEIATRLLALANAASATWAISGRCLRPHFGSVGQDHPSPDVSDLYFRIRFPGPAFDRRAAGVWRIILETVMSTDRREWARCRESAGGSCSDWCVGGALAQPMDSLTKRTFECALGAFSRGMSTAAFDRATQFQNKSKEIGHENRCHWWNRPYRIEDS
jgi:hypothetical protein